MAADVVETVDFSLLVAHDNGALASYFLDEIISYSSELALMLVGHQSQLARVGDYFVQEVAGESAIIVRDQKGEVHGFYNVCRHRGTRLCEDQSGHGSAIQCPYHAWT